jgi:hypothetical protein
LAAASSAAASPPGPPPITIRSYFSDIDHLSITANAN